MKRLVSVTLFATVFFALSCKSKDQKTEAKQNNTVSEKTVTTEEKDNTEVVTQSSDISKAAVGYCECFNDNFKNIDPKIKQIIIKAGSSDNPFLVLQSELVNTSDPKEQKRLAEEMQKFSDSKSMSECSKRIEKDYKLNENDPKTQRLVLKALEQNGNCELVAAFMRIGLKQSEMNKNNPGANGQ